MWGDDDNKIENVKICVDVSGFLFYTMSNTLTKSPYFEDILTNIDTKTLTDDNIPYIFVDRDANGFTFILNYLRTGQLFLCDDNSKGFFNFLKCEANFYKLYDLSSLIDTYTNTKTFQQELISELKLCRTNVNKPQRTRTTDWNH